MLVVAIAMNRSAHPIYPINESLSPIMIAPPSAANSVSDDRSIAATDASVYFCPIACSVNASPPANTAAYIISVAASLSVYIENVGSKGIPDITDIWNPMSPSTPAIANWTAVIVTGSPISLTA